MGSTSYAYEDAQEVPQSSHWENFTDKDLSTEAQRLEFLWSTNNGALSPEAIQVPFGIHNATDCDRLVPTIQQRGSFSARFAFLRLEALMRRQSRCVKYSFDTQAVGENPAPTAALHLRERLSAGEEVLEREALRCTTTWARGVVGVVSSEASSEALWTSALPRLQAQLDFASFLGLAAVLVPLPLVCSGSSVEMSRDAREAALLCTATKVLLSFIQRSPSIQVWLECEASGEDAIRARKQFHLLRAALLYGCPHCPSGRPQPVGRPVYREAIGVLQLYLRLTERDWTAPPGEWKLSAAWLGEPVAGVELSASAWLRLVCHHEVNEGGGDFCAMVRALARDYPPMQQLWARRLPSRELSCLHWITELLRRRSVPVFTDAVSLIPQLLPCVVRLRHVHHALLSDPRRSTFEAYENVLQLPLQPLAHHLASGVYEVFEEDTAKYEQYGEAIHRFAKDWKESKLFHHASLDTTGSVPQVLYVVMIGCGRGPLIRACLRACTAVGVPLHLFAIEKNLPAAAYTAWCWDSDPAYRALLEDCHVVEVIHIEASQLLEKHVAGQLPLPPRFGWCDVVISELLGSLGDNELSPECLEGFYGVLRGLWKRRGMPPHPHLQCIPSSYTAYIAPIHSTTIEDVLAETWVKGLTVYPPSCPRDRHEAVIHQLFVSNISKAVSLASPAKLWSFDHYSAMSEAETKERPLARTGRVEFNLPSDSRVCGLAGYFSAILYTPKGDPHAVPIALSTRPEDHTPGMFSWFPCLLPFDPQLFPSALDGRDGPRSIAVTVKRCVHLTEKRVWYTWKAEEVSSDKIPVKDSAQDAAFEDEEPGLYSNSNGWAASVYL